MAHGLLLMGVRSNKTTGGNKMTTTKNLLSENEIDNLLNRLEIAAAFKQEDDFRSLMTDVATSAAYAAPVKDETPNWRMTLHG